MFCELNETEKMKVSLGNGKEIQVDGIGIVTISTKEGKTKMIHA